MAMNLYQRRFGLAAPDPAMKQPMVEKQKFNNAYSNNTPKLHLEVKCRSEARYATFVLLQNNHIQFATKAFMPVFREIPINGFIAARNYNDDLSIEKIAVEDEKLYVYCGLYRLKFDLPHFTHLDTQLVDDNLGVVAPDYQVTIGKMVNYIGDTSRSENKKYHVRELLKLLVHKHYQTARTYAASLLGNKEFTKAIFFKSRAENLVNELLKVTNHFSFNLADIPEPVIITQIKQEKDEVSKHPEIAFLDFPKQKYIRPSEKIKFIQLVDEVIHLARNGKNFIPKIQAWFNCLMTRHEWILNDLELKKHGETGFAHIYGTIDTGKYKLLYKQLYQYISVHKHKEFESLLKMIADILEDDPINLYDKTQIVKMQGCVDDGDYVARLKQHIEYFMCVL